MCPFRAHLLGHAPVEHQRRLFQRKQKPFLGFGPPPRRPLPPSISPPPPTPPRPPPEHPHYPLSFVRILDAGLNRRPPVKC
eukprot:9481082-Pyramimonas_sp.AAC.1